MSCVLQYDSGDIGSHQFNLPPQNLAIGFLAADGKNWHRKFRSRKTGEIIGCLLERYEIGPACPHASRSRVRGGIHFAVRFGDGMCFVGGEVVPEMFEVDALAPRY